MSTTTTGLSQAMGQYYDKLFLKVADYNMVHDTFGQKRQIPMNMGKTVNFTRFAALSTVTTPINEVTLPDECDLSAVNVSATVSPYGCYTKVSRLFELTSLDVNLKAHVERFGQQAGETVDELIRTTLVNGAGTVQYAGGVANDAAITSAQTMSSTEIRRAVRTLKDNRATKMSGGLYGMILSPRASFDLQADNTWLTANQFGSPEDIKKGEVNKLLGVMAVETNNPYEAATGFGGANVVSTFVLGEEAYGIVDIQGDSKTAATPGKPFSVMVKTPGPNSTDNPLDQFSTVGWHVIFTSVMLNGNFAVDIHSYGD